MATSTVERLATAKNQSYTSGLTNTDYGGRRIADVQFLSGNVRFTCPSSSGYTGILRFPEVPKETNAFYPIVIRYGMVVFPTVGKPVYHSSEDKWHLEAFCTPEIVSTCSGLACDATFDFFYVVA